MLTGGDSQLIARRHRLVLAAALAAAALLCVPGIAAAAPSAANVAAAQAASDRAVAKYAAAQQRMDKIEARVAETTANLDELIAEQDRLQVLLGARADGIYRHGHLSFVAVLTRSATFQQFASAWDMLARVGRQDAVAVAALKAARAKTSRTARRLVADQERVSAQLRGLERAKADAEQRLSTSKAARASYLRRISALRARRVAKSRAATPEPAASAPAPSGSGAWKTGGASHYGRGSWGRRTADGTRIGPDSMIVAHKTLPFGTLVEFEFRGRTAVARVADRGPYVRGRDWDLGPGVIRILGFNGVHQVRYRVIGR